MIMLYDIEYQEIDDKISYCQMGGKKNRGCRKNLFTLNGIVHNIARNKEIKSSHFTNNIF